MKELPPEAYSPQYVVKLAQIEERLSHVVQTLDKVAAETEGLGYVKANVAKQAEEVQKLRDSFIQMRGAVVVLSALTGLLAGWLPEWLLQR